MRLETPLGFSLGAAEFALTNPPPLVPSSLITSCEAIGPPVIVCWVPVIGRDRLVGVEILRDSGPHEHESENDRRREQHVEQRACEIDPEISRASCR